ncbi:cytochrome c biogenesis CcdA family protein [Microbacterium azadirachtae]|uniref:Cytochrome C biogenesis protein transmembrane region n=1 Tax=Microbacterium azadirachtae TaxID=582680 RepID=A0A0F0M033_9MICO|nr:cytochrome c biogenesis protein CcdA [Microbacterium azadirachtae]KJL37006.1 Cytochrome C biogenesis protein transmembrane region [Microbacterium azadirachtae]
MNIDAIVGSGALWAALPVAMLAGLLSFLSPCVLPLVPGYLGFVGGAVGGSAPRQDGTTNAPTRRQMVLGVLLFILGFTLVFILMAVVGGTAGVFLLRWGDLITRILGAVIIVMGLVFIGVFGFAQRTVRMNVSGRAGLIGAPLLGVALGIGWSPCLSPTLSAIVALSVNVGDVSRAVWLGIAYSLGLGIPFLLVALGFGWATRSLSFLRRHVRVVNIVGGALLIVLGLLMVTGVWKAIMSSIGAVVGSVELPL